MSVSVSSSAVSPASAASVISIPPPQITPIYISFDSSSLSHTGIQFPDFLSALSSNSSSDSDVFVLTRDEILQNQGKKKTTKNAAANSTAASGDAAASASGAAASQSSGSSAASKKKSPKDMTDEEKKEAEKYSFDELFVDSIKDKVDSELSTRIEFMKEKRKNEVEAVSEPGNQTANASKEKGKTGKSTGKTAGKESSAPGSALQSPTAASKSAAASSGPLASPSGKSKKGDKTPAAAATTLTAPQPTTPAGPTEDEAREAAERAAARDRLLASYSTPLFLLVVLVDVVQRPHDLDRLQAGGLNVDAITVFVSESDRAGAQFAGDVGLPSSAALHVELEEQTEFLIGRHNATPDEAAASSKSLIHSTMKERIHPFDRAAFNGSDKISMVARAASFRFPAAAQGPIVQLLAHTQANQNKFMETAWLSILTPEEAKTPHFGSDISKPAVSEKDGERVKSPRTRDSASSSGSSKKPGSAMGSKRPLDQIDPFALRALQEYLLTLREFAHFKKEYQQWRAGVAVKKLPIWENKANEKESDIKVPSLIASAVSSDATGVAMCNGASSTRFPDSALPAVDMRMYEHVLASAACEVIDIHSICYAMFEQVNANASSIDVAAMQKVEELNELEQWMDRSWEKVAAVMAEGPAAEPVQPEQIAQLSSSRHLWLAGHCTHCSASLSVLRHQIRQQLMVQQQRLPSEEEVSDSIKAQICPAAAVSHPSVSQFATGVGADNKFQSPQPKLIREGDEYQLRKAHLNYGQKSSNRAESPAPLSSEYILHQSHALAHSSTPIPGVSRVGIPCEFPLSHWLRGQQLLQLYSTQSSIPLSTMQKAIQAMELEEMITELGPDYREASKLIMPLPGVDILPESSAAADSLSCSPFFIDHLARESSPVEQSIESRLKEMFPEFKMNRLALTNDDISRYQLDSREYREEFDASTLAQILGSSILDSTMTGCTTIQGRYNPFSDEFYLLFHTPIPVNRCLTTQWDDYFTPNLSFQHYLAASPAIQRTKPTQFCEYSPSIAGSFSGKFSVEQRVYFPSDLGKVGQWLRQSGEKVDCSVWIEKDGHFISMEQQEIQVKSIRKTPKFQPHQHAAAPDAAVEKKEEAASGEAELRTKSRGGAAQTASTTPSAANAEKKKSKKEAAEEAAAAAAAARESELAAQREEREAALRAAREAAALIDSRSIQDLVLTARFADRTRLTIAGSQGTVSHTAINGLIVQIRKDDTIYQSFAQPQAAAEAEQSESLWPVPPSFQSSSLPSRQPYLIRSEYYRLIQSDGSVIKYMRDGSIQILAADGASATRAANSQRFIWTDACGARSDGSADVPMQTIYDPETRIRVFSRSDLSCFLEYPNGSTLAQHADGTRIYTDVLESRRAITVEQLGYAPVTFSHTKEKIVQEDGKNNHGANGRRFSATSGLWIVDRLEIEVTVHDYTVIRKQANNWIRVFKPDLTEILFNPLTLQGIMVPRAVHHSAAHKPELQSALDALWRGEFKPNEFPRDLYWINFVGPVGFIRILDSEDNEFKLFTNGRGESMLGRNRSLINSSSSVNKSHQPSGSSIPDQYFPLPNPVIPPRFFVIRGDSSGYELLPNERVDEYLQQFQLNPFGLADWQRRHAIPLPVEPLEFPNDDPQLPHAVSLKFLTPIRLPSTFLRRPVLPPSLYTGPGILFRTHSHQSAIPHSYFLYRQLIHEPPIPKKVRTAVQALKTKFLEEFQGLQSGPPSPSNDQSAGHSGDEFDRRIAEQLGDKFLAIRRQLIEAQHQQQQYYQAEEQAKLAASFEAGDIPLESTEEHKFSGKSGHGMVHSGQNVPRPLESKEEKEAERAWKKEMKEKRPDTFFQPKSNNKKGGKSSVQPVNTNAASQSQSPEVENYQNFIRDLFTQRMTTFLNKIRSLPSNDPDNDHSSTSERFTAVSHLCTLLDYLFPLSNSNFYEYPHLRRLSLHQYPWNTLLNRDLTLRLWNLLGFERESNETYTLTLADREEWANKWHLIRVKVLEIEPEAILVDLDADQIKEAEGGRTENRNAQMDVDVQAEEDNGDVEGEADLLERSAEQDELDHGQYNGEYDAPEQGNARMADEDQESLAGGSEFEYDRVSSELAQNEREEKLSKSQRFQESQEREKRLRSLPSTFSPTHHLRHGKSFQYNPVQSSLQADSSLNSSVNTYPIRIPREPYQHASIQYDAAGQPRRDQVPLPSHLIPAAPAHPNLPYLASELQSGQPRHTVKISSTVRTALHSQTAGFTDFQLQPAAVHFGTVKKGFSYRSTVALTNTGSLTGRFTVIPPQLPSDDLCSVQVLYRPGLIAPGLQKKLDIELFAGAAGEFRTQIIIKTEQSVFHLPITARIVSGEVAAAEEAALAHSHSQLSTTSGSTVAYGKKTALSRSISKSTAHSSSQSTVTVERPFQNPSTFDGHIASAGPAFGKTGKMEAAEKSRANPQGNFGPIGKVRVVKPQKPAEPQNSSASQGRRVMGNTQRVDSAGGSRPGSGMAAGGSRAGSASRSRNYDDY